jgi:superfamily II DNA or RNA helicase
MLREPSMNQQALRDGVDRSIGGWPKAFAEDFVKVDKAKGVILVHRYGNIVRISSYENVALPADLLQALTPALSYWHKEFVFGVDRYDEFTQQEVNVRTVRKVIYRIDKLGRLIVPFGLAHRCLDIILDNRYSVCCFDKTPYRPHAHETDWDNVTRHFSFRTGQLECLQRIAVSPCGLIWSPTGFGKMVIITMTCLLYPSAKIHIVVRRVELANKLFEFISRYIPDVGLVGASRRIKSRVTIYVAASLHHSDFDADILLADEAHELLAERSSQYLSRYRFSRNYAFTATPKGRFDNADIRMEVLFGRTIYFMSYEEAVQKGLVIPIMVFWVPVDGSALSYSSMVAKERYGIWRNAKRNQIIASIAKALPDDWQTLILVRTVEHGCFLKELLPDYTLVFDSLDYDRYLRWRKQGLVSSDIRVYDDDERRQLRQDFEANRLKKVIATYIWAVGIDPVHLRALIRADASGSEIMAVQAPGRLSRIGSIGKDYGIVIDFLDSFDSAFRAKSSSRRKMYRQLGWQQITLSSWEDIMAWMKQS